MILFLKLFGSGGVTGPWFCGAADPTVDGWKGGGAPPPIYHHRQHLQQQQQQQFNAPNGDLDYERIPFPPPGLAVRSIDDFLLTRRLGCGKFSDVFEAVDSTLVAEQQRLHKGDAAASGPHASPSPSKDRPATASTSQSLFAVDPATVVVVKCLKPVSERKIKREVAVLRRARDLPNLVGLLAVVVPRGYSSAERDETELPRMPSLILRHAGPDSRWLCHGSSFSSSGKTNGAGGNKNDSSIGGGGDGFLTDYEIRYYLCHLLAALSGLHARGIMHRDVKPRNVLINGVEEEEEVVVVEGDGGRSARRQQLHRRRRSRHPPLALIDLGLADFYHPGQRYNVRVASRHYKSPELLVGYEHYDFAIDMWGVGCILAGLLLRREPFFRGKDNADQLAKVAAVLGTDDLVMYMRRYGLPVTADIRGILERCPHRGRRSLLSCVRRDVDDIMAAAVPTADGLDLLNRLLVYDHEARPTAMEAMRHRFFDSVRARVQAEVLGYASGGDGSGSGSKDIG